MAKTAITETISRFIVDTSLSKMPARGIMIAKEAIMDCLGCTLLGAVQPAGKIISKFVVETAAKPVASIVGQGRKTVPHLAALANGTMAHAEDYDDTSLVIFGHPSAPQLPAILALGEQHKVSGKQVIEAYITGFEVGSVVGQELNRSHYNRGWHSTATVGTMEAVAASAKILKLDMNQTRMAFGIAASEAGGIRQNFGTMTKPFHAGNAARSGVVAAELARMGFTASLNIIEAPLGFGDVFQGDEAPDWEKDFPLGKTFEIATSGIAFKPYPTGAETHAGIEAIAELRRRHRFAPEDVESIECVFNETMNSILLHSAPRTGLEGKFSAEYCIARALFDGKVTVKDFTDEMVNQPEVKQLLPKIRRRIEPAMNLIATTINVKLKHGDQLSRHVEIPKGWPENPLSEEELVAKYKDCAQFVLSPRDIARSVELLYNLEAVEDITGLMQIVGKTTNV